MKILDVYNELEKIAPFDSCMDFDNVGLLIGDKNADVKKILIALDLTYDVIDEASEVGANLVITHHPVIFSPLKSISEKSVVYKAIALGINVISAHTNLDKSKTYGVNTALAKKLSLESVTPLSEEEPLFIGELEEEMSTLQLAEFIKDRLNSNKVLFTDCNKKIKRLAFSSGGAGDSVFKVIGEADAFLTGEARHHEFLFAKENGFPMFCAGHYETEKPFAKLLKEYLEEKFVDIEIYLSVKEQNPVSAC